MSSVGPIYDQPAKVLPDFRLPNRALGVIAALSDGLVIIISSVLARLFYSGLNAANGDDVSVGLVAAVVFVAVAKYWGLYRFQPLLTPGRVASRIVSASLVSSAAVVCLGFLLKIGAEYSRGAVVGFAIISSVLEPGLRFLLAAAARSAIKANLLRGRRIVLIGEHGELERLTPAETLNFGIDEVGRFALSQGGGLEELSVLDRSRIDQAIRAARVSRAAEFGLILPWSRDRALSMINLSLSASPLPVRLYPDYRTRDILLQKRDSHFDPYLSVKIQREPLTGYERSLKRAMDISVSLLGLICLSPLMLMAAVLIKVDSPGPILFLQTRRGFDNRSFKIWKFRTMVVLEDGAGIRQARREDQRVTRIGRLLRRTSVDELPQLVNVMRGDMSIVGPRPHAVAHDEEYETKIFEYALRRHVKPGLTGAAQVAGLRGETRTLELMEARVERDLWYINNWSLWLDIKIIATTFIALLTQEAY